MSIFNKISQSLNIANSHGIIRRYFVVNGFDGALTMLGLMLGFAFTENSDFHIALNVCMAAAIALAISGVSSAYVSESSERSRALSQLQRSMLIDLTDSSHGRAAKWVPMIVALVNGLSPLCICLLILSPIWLANRGVNFTVSPYLVAIGVAFFLMFLLGVFLGLTAGSSGLWGGVRTLLIGFVTVGLIYLFAGL